MGLRDYFRPVSTWSVQTVREFMEDKNHEDYNLVDVRQPGEYEEKHLPGAKLIPVGELAARLDELDPQKPTIAYCAAGVRSRAAASLLSRSGFKDVHSMGGGLMAWEGILAHGFPEPLIAYFTPAGAPGEYIALAWILEDGTAGFYGKMGKKFDKTGLAGFFGQLAELEERHKAELVKLYGSISDGEAGADFPRGILSDYPKDRFIEGGMLLEEALGWTEGKQAKEVLDLCIAIETIAYDRYIIMAQQVEDALSKEVFELLSREEKKHLGSMTERIGKITAGP